MRVCYFGFYDPEYPRNASLRRGLEAAGVTVLECNGPMELAPTHMRSTGVSGLSLARLRQELHAAWRSIQARRYLARTFRDLDGPIDAVVVAEFNQEFVPLARRLSRDVGAALVVDFFVSLYETSVIDRQAVFRYGPRAIGRYVADARAIRLADRLFVDTLENGQHFHEMFGGMRGKTFEIPLGAPEWVHSPTPLPERGERPLNVLWFGAYIPLHGLHTIIRAAKFLDDGGRFQFQFVGSGQLYDEIRELSHSEGCTNTEFKDWVSQDELRGLLRESDICLGIFGTTRKALGCIPNKVWQCMANGRPVITSANPTSERFLTAGEDALLVPPGDPAALAEALERLAADPDLAQTLARNAADLIRNSYTSGPLGARLLQAIEELKGSGTRP